MLVDGVHIADGVYDSIRERVLGLKERPVLGIVVCNPNFETKKYLALKEKKASEIGIEVIIEELPEDATEDDFEKAIEDLSMKSDGVILQLPLPTHIEIERLLATIPTSKDVDVLNPNTSGMLSPVVLAIKLILEHYRQGVQDKDVVVVGQGRLVGAPATKWFRSEGARVTPITKDDKDITTKTKSADILVTGVGIPGLISSHMVKEGVVVLDAGTSEDGGELKGDVDGACAGKASLFTPVPGGIGPVTIAMLLQNVVRCAEKKESVV